MISVADVLLLHEFSIRDYGGAKELRDIGLLLSAITRPYQTFDGNELYPSPIEKAVALGERIITNHPFLDGNKRTAFLAMVALLKEYGIHLVANENEAYSFVIEMSQGKRQFIDIVTWLTAKTA